MSKRDHFNIKIFIMERISKTQPYTVRDEGYSQYRSNGLYSIERSECLPEFYNWTVFHSVLVTCPKLSLFMLHMFCPQSIKYCSPVK